MSSYFYGVVEDLEDPFKLGRCRVRIVGLHNANRSELPTEDLPWAIPIQPIYSASVNGIGNSPTGLVEGAWVVCIFTEPEQQTPLIIGSVGGIPSSRTAFTDDIESEFDGVEPQVPADQVYVQTGTGGILTTTDGTPVTVSNAEAGDKKYLGSMTKDQYDRLKQRIAERESSNNYQAVEKKNGHYLGKYQMGAAKLTDYGYISKDAYKKYGAAAVDHPDAWTGKDGMSSKQNFLDSPVLQEQVMDRSLKSSYQSVVNGTGIDGTTADPGKMGGLLYVAHNQGNGAAKKFLNSDGKVQAADGNGQTSSNAYEIGYEGVTGGKPNGELPTKENISDKPAVNPDPAAANDARKYDTTQAPEVKKREVQNVAKGQAGFTDPNGVYPKQQFMNEPDTNRLARHQKINQTIVYTKEQERTLKVPVANSAKTWDQPPIPYNARYPFNHVMETRSGHVLEFDDTPERERINLHHKSGTFSEVDVTGTKTSKIKGSKVLIVEENDLVYVIGSGHVCIGGDLSVKVLGKANIDVGGDASINVGGSVYSKVAADFHMDVGGDYRIKCGGTASFKTGEDFAVDTGAAVFLNSGKSSAPVTIPEYSPEITLPEPFTRQEAADITLENTPEMAEKRTEEAKALPPVTEQKKDETPPPKRDPVTSECDFIMPLSASTQLSQNFKIRDLVTGSHRFPFGGSQRGLTDAQIACNLKHLCINVVEPLFEKYAQYGIKINSGFRNGNGKSQHEIGQAADFGVTKYTGNRKEFMFNLAKEIKGSVPFDQLLFETTSGGSVWIHVSFTKSGNRSQVLTFNDHKTVAQGLVLLA